MRHAENVVSVSEALMNGQAMPIAAGILQRTSRTQEVEQKLYGLKHPTTTGAESFRQRNQPMTNRTQTLTTLAARAEQAGVEDQEKLIEEAAEHFWGRSFVSEYGDPKFWLRRWSDFARMIAAEAFTDAARMLKPEGWGLLIDEGYDDRSDGPCDVNVNWIEDGYLEHAHAKANTPALAILAAICKAVAQEEG